MSAKKEKLIKITKDEDGSEVRVYKEFDQENPYFTGEPRFIHKENDNAEEVEMQPFEIDIDELNEKQDMGLLHPSGALENKLNLKIPIHSEYALSPKKWLTESNWALYLQQLIEKMEHWKKNNEPFDTESAKTLHLLKKESSNPESQSIKIVETNSRTPHGKYAAYSRASGMLRIEAWNEFKQLAVKCTQTNEPVDLPGFGKIFLKLDYKNPDSSIRYKMTAFEGKNDLGKKTTKKAFEDAWQKN
jgi:hypothetical protein